MFAPGTNSVYWLLDRLSLLQRFKIPRSRQQALQSGLLRKTLGEIVLGALVLDFPVGYGLYHVFHWFGTDLRGPLPSTATVFVQVRGDWALLDTMRTVTRWCANHYLVPHTPTHPSDGHMPAVFTIVGCWRVSGETIMMRTR